VPCLAFHFGVKTPQDRFSGHCIQHHDRERNQGGQVADTKKPTGVGFFLTGLLGYVPADQNRDHLQAVGFSLSD